jgi:hypothetical protein
MKAIHQIVSGDNQQMNLLKNKLLQDALSTNPSIAVDLGLQLHVRIMEATPYINATLTKARLH